MPRSRLEVEQRSVVAVDDAKVAVGDRVAVGIVGREAELLVDLRLELFRERVLEQLGLRVHLVEREPEPVDEVALEQPVVTEHLERAEPPGFRERDTAMRHPLDEPELGEALRHRGRRRGATPMRLASADVVTRSPADSRA